MERRQFMRLSGSLLALGGGLLRLRHVQAAPLKPYQRVKLVDANGKTFKASLMQEKTSYLFFYPYAGTPCFLLNLGTSHEQLSLKSANGKPYQWPGGVGPEQSIVAYTAICAHQATHVSRRKSFINYNPEEGEFAGVPGRITCCLHGSVFDPARGGEVVGGPAPQPLTAISLGYDAETDTLHAVGTYGGEVFQDYFKAYRKELRQEFGRGVATQESSGAAAVMLLSSYTKRQFFC